MPDRPDAGGTYPREPRPNQIAASARDAGRPATLGIARAQRLLHRVVRLTSKAFGAPLRPRMTVLAVLGGAGVLAVGIVWMLMATGRRPDPARRRPRPGARVEAVVQTP